MRGNDPEAASELATRYGLGAGNAEALIEANAARFSQDLVAAQMLPRRQEASEELKHADVAKVADLPDGHRLRAASVRYGEGDENGGYVVFVAEDPSGRLYKGALAREDGKIVAGPQEVRTSADVHAASLKADVAARQKSAQAIAEAEAEAQAGRDRLLAEAQQTVREAHEEADRIRQEAAEALQKVQDGGSGSGGEAGSGSGSSSSSRPRSRSRSRAKKSGSSGSSAAGE